MEFAELRYAGQPAAFLRGFRARLPGLPGQLPSSWAGSTWPWPRSSPLTLGLTTTRQQLTGVFCCLALTRRLQRRLRPVGRARTDLLQFILKMSMVIVLAYFAVHAIGGMGALATQMHAFDARPRHRRRAARITLAFIPDPTSPSFLSFLVLLALNWWASWYPGAEPGGGGYIAQRIFSAKDEKHSLGATLWFNIAHYAAAPLALDHDRAGRARAASQPHCRARRNGRPYVQVMVDYLPPACAA